VISVEGTLVRGPFLSFDPPYPSLQEISVEATLVRGPFLSFEPPYPPLQVISVEATLVRGLLLSFGPLCPPLLSAFAASGHWAPKQLFIHRAIHLCVSTECKTSCLSLNMTPDVTCHESTGM
jgi:hypothetical protein